MPSAGRAHWRTSMANKVDTLTSCIKACKDDKACVKGCEDAFVAEGGKVFIVEEGGKVFSHGEGGKVFITKGGKVF